MGFIAMRLNLTQTITITGLAGFWADKARNYSKFY